MDVCVHLCTHQSPISPMSMVVITVDILISSKFFMDQVAKTLGLSQNDLIRWFIDRGPEAVAKGVKPPIAEVVSRRYDPGR